MDVEETTAERYQRELNALIEAIANGATDDELHIGTLDETYFALARSIVAATNAYVAMRVIEELLEGDN